MEETALGTRDGEPKRLAPIGNKVAPLAPLVPTGLGSSLENSQGEKHKHNMLQKQKHKNSNMFASGGHVLAEAKSHLQLPQDAAAALARKYDEVGSKVLDPHSKGMYRWDMFIAILLIYTAVLAPVEVVFSKNLKFDALFYINRFVDGGFIIDLYFQFRLSYFSAKTGKWVLDQKLIALHYMQTWFLLDILATTPWDLISYGIEKSMEANTEAASDSNLESLKLLRLLKILKLAKLLRLLKSMRIFDNIIEQIGMAYNVKALLKYFAIMLVLVHLVACFWVFTREFVDNPECLLADPAPDPVANTTRQLKGGSSSGISTNTEGEQHCSWITRVRMEHGAELTDYDMYVIALEYALSVMCMGYGTASPTNNAEWRYSVFCLVFAGATYAYMVGAICACVQNEEPGVTEFKTNRDMLHKLCRTYDIDHDVRHKALDFYNFCKPLVLTGHQMESLKFLPENMRSMITFAMYGEWITKVKFFFSKEASDKEQRAFLVSISAHIEPVALPPREILYDSGDPIDSLYIVNVGIFQSMAGGVSHWAQKLHIYSTGDYFGTDVVMRHQEGRLDSVSTLTYCAASTLRRDAMFEVLDGHLKLFSNIRHSLRMVAIRISMAQRVRGIGVVVMQLKRNMGVPRMNKDDIARVKQSFKRCHEEKVQHRNSDPQWQESTRRRTGEVIRGSELVQELRDLSKCTDLAHFFSDVLHSTEEDVSGKIWENEAYKIERSTHRHMDTNERINALGLKSKHSSSRMVHKPTL